MKISLPVLLLLTFICLLFPVMAEPKAKLRTISLDVNGVARTALIAVPEGTGRPVPVVFAYHGHGGSSANAARSMSVHIHWPEALVIYPQGLTGTPGITDPEGRKTGWQKRPEDHSDRDVLFFDALLAKAADHRTLDPNRLHVMGHSNGSRFACVLWALRGDKIASICSSGGHGLGLLEKAPKRSAFMIAGKADKIVPFAGQEQSITAMHRLLNTDAAKMENKGLLTRFPAENGLELVTYIHPGGHAYPREAVPAIVAFFKRTALVKSK